MDPFTISRLGVIRQQELLRQVAAMPERTPVPLVRPIVVWLRSIFRGLKLPMPARRRISRG